MGTQVDSGWFFQSSKESLTTIRINKLNQRFDVLGGFDTKISKRIFRLDEILQIVYSNVDRVDLRMYNVTIVLKVSKFNQYTKHL